MRPAPANNSLGVRVAVVDDEPTIRESLRTYFETAGFQVFTADSAESFRRAVDRERIDLFLLDIKLPDCDGLTLMREVRDRTDAPVILVTSCSDEIDRVVGLELGADDYVTKPFSIWEFLARVNTLLRRTNTEVKDEKVGVRRFAGWILDLESHRLTSPDGKSSRLTRGEFDLLAALIRYPGKIMSRDELIASVTDREWNSNDRTIDVLISRLRRKIEPEPGKSRLIATEYGIGYVFTGPVT
ncbi:response regulator transcription factor [Breoghania sp.]|uniref:response regulator transcription factor n=1 Tax=Breoghania sp. TaxID=2065378 RepID=UPI00261CE3B7|nr:response regulator transcription factor [Breoghania sp.]MDJ0929732.1 response regulator transcription factor [Breoghania sp.]